jgi:hypothetical protein
MVNISDRIRKAQRSAAHPQPEATRSEGNFSHKEWQRAGTRSLPVKSKQRRSTVSKMATELSMTQCWKTIIWKEDEETRK